MKLTFVYCVIVFYVGRSKQTRPWLSPAGRITNPCQNQSRWVLQIPWERHGWLRELTFNHSNLSFMLDYWPSQQLRAQTCRDGHKCSRFQFRSVKLNYSHPMFCECFEFFFYAIWWLHFDKKESVMCAHPTTLGRCLIIWNTLQSINKNRHTWEQ